MKEHYYLLEDHHHDRGAWLYAGEGMSVGRVYTEQGQVNMLEELGSGSQKHTEFHFLFNSMEFCILTPI